MGWRSKGACKASRSPSRQTIGSFIENLADMPRHILTDIRSAGQAAAEEGGIRTDLRRSANPEVGATLGHPDSCLAVTAKADTASGENTRPRTGAQRPVQHIRPEMPTARPVGERNQEGSTPATQAAVAR